MSESRSVAYNVPGFAWTPNGMAVYQTPAEGEYVLASDYEELRKRFSESASSLEAAQKQIEHVRGGRDSAHMARKEARKDRTEAVELLQRASVYAHGLRWPQELFDAVRALLTKYENGLKLLEGPK